MTQSFAIPRLETDRLILRGHTTDDFPACAAMWADPAVVAKISGTPSSEEQSWARFLRYAGHWHHLGFGYWAVTAKEDGRYLGDVGFADYHRDTSPSLRGKPEAGWVLNASAHGKGYATEAVSAILTWADTTLPHSQTVAIFDPTHAASIHVAKKVGFTNETLGRYGDAETLFMERAKRSA